MAFDIAGLNCIAVGPTKLYIYNTTDIMMAASTTAFNTTSCPGMAAGDIVLVAHNTATRLSLIRITQIAGATHTNVGVSALA